MYNGIGLTTPRGSGTNGYVQRNISFIARNKDKINYRTEEDLKKLDSLVNKKPNEGILAHEKKRVIELKCLQLQEQLEEEGWDEEKIVFHIDELRKALYDKDVSLKNEVPKDDFGRPLVKESHQMAEANQEKNMKMREALGISQYFVEGSSLDPEHKAKEAAAEAAAQAKAQKKYALVPDSLSSSDSEREVSKEKSKKKKASKRTEEPIPHKKKKTSKKEQRDRSESVEGKRKKKSKKSSKEKSKHKKNKTRNHSLSSSSPESDSSQSSAEKDSSSSDSNPSYSSGEISSSDDERHHSSSHQKKKKHSSKHSKSHHDKRSLKKMSSKTSSHHKDRQSRKDKYESAKKKKLSTRESHKRVHNSSDSSDGDSSPKQYYRLEPVFVKSKSKHKKDRQIIDKRKVFSIHESKEKHDDKKRKRKYSSSSSSSFSRSEDGRSHGKKRKGSSSPVGREKHHRDKNKANSDRQYERTHSSRKDGKKHRKDSLSSSEEHVHESSKRQRSHSRSLSYSPIPNSRSTHHFSKKSSTGGGGYTSYKEILLSESDKQKVISGKGLLEVEKSSRRPKDLEVYEDDRNAISSDNEEDYKRKNKHNGYPKSHSSQKLLTAKKRHDSSSSESDDHEFKKRSKNEKRVLIEQSFVKKKSLSPKQKKSSRKRSSSNDTIDSAEQKIYEKGKSYSKSRGKHLKGSSNVKSSKSRSRSVELVKKSKYYSIPSSSHEDFKETKPKSHRGRNSTSPDDYKKQKIHSSQQSAPSPKRDRENTNVSESIVGKNRKFKGNKHSPLNSQSRSPSPSDYEKLRNNKLRKNRSLSKDVSSLPKEDSAKKSNSVVQFENNDQKQSSQSPHQARLNSNKSNGKASVVNSEIKSLTPEKSPNNYVTLHVKSSSHQSLRAEIKTESSEVQSPSSKNAICKDGNLHENNKSSENNLFKDTLTRNKASESSLYQGIGSPKNEKSLKEKLMSPNSEEERKESPLLIKPQLMVKPSTKNHSKSPIRRREVRSRSRDSSTSSRHEKSKSRSRSRSQSESKSRSHSRSDSRSRSRSSSASRSRSRSKSYSYSSSRSRSYSSRSHSRSVARSPSIPRRKGSPSFLDKRRITRARSVSFVRKYRRSVSYTPRRRRRRSSSFSSYSNRSRRSSSYSSVY